jgi:hypothetical protein
MLNRIVSHPQKLAGKDREPRILGKMTSAGAGHEVIHFQSIMIYLHETDTSVSQQYHCMFYALHLLV